MTTAREPSRNEERLQARVAIYSVFIENSKVLLLRRSNTGWADGKFSIPGGHLEEGERLVEGVIREIEEETSIVTEEQNLKLAHVLYRRKAVGDNYDYVDHFFTVSRYSGQIKNNEPHLHDIVDWYPLESLPKETLPYIKLALENIQKGKSFDECTSVWD